MGKRRYYRFLLAVPGSGRQIQGLPTIFIAGSATPSSRKQSLSAIQYPVSVTVGNARRATRE
jgi:hypothetical protein